MDQTRQGTGDTIPRRLMVAAFAAAVLMVTTACTSDGAEGRRDDRAYAVDSGKLTLEQGLQRSGIRVPECLDTGLRYALVDDGFGYYHRVYLSLRTSEECMNEFLQDNRIRHYVTHARQVETVEWQEPLKVRPLWMDRQEVVAMEWRVGADQSLMNYGGRTRADYVLDVYLQRVAGTSDVLGYLYAFHCC